MSITNHTIAVTINDVDKTSSLLKDSVFVRLQLNNKGSIAELKFKNYDPPERGQVEIYVNGTIVYGGFIVRKSASLLGVKNSADVIWSVECKDWSEVLEIPRINQAYSSQSDRIIIASLFGIAFDETGFDFDASTDVATLDSAVDITFTDVSLSEALNLLAKKVGASWFIKPDKKIYWFSKSSPTAASFSISSSPNQTTSFGFLNNSLSYQVDSSTIVNQVKIVNGAVSNGEKLYESNVGTGSQKTFALGEIPNSVAYVGWNDGLGSYSSYGSFIGYAPGDKLKSAGGNYLVVVDPVAKTISVEGPSGLAPANYTGIEVQYYKKELITTTVDDLTSQSLFGIFPYSIEGKEFSNSEAATALANSILAQNAYGKTSLKFDTTKYGLMPGQLLSVDISEMLVMQGWVDNVLQTEDDYSLLTESGDFFLLESYANGRTFLVQEVSLQPQVTATNQFMMVCQVTAGSYEANIIDSLASVSELKSSSSINSQTGIPTKLSNVSADLGEVQIGRAVFTDGGTARFQWGTPNYASGVVVGLEDTSALQGAMYIYDSGTVKVKLGNLNDQPAIGTIIPSGWGIYTDNGFFKGVVYASQLIGGTVTGSSIVGGTVTGGTIIGGFISGGTLSAGFIEGGTITSPTIVAGNISSGTISAVDIRGNTLTANSLISGTITGNSINGGTVTGSRIVGGSIVGNTIIGGTIATGTPPINSSNPGVLMDSAGLYGYGTAGLTFRLSSDPAIKPWFSSGTILNTVYEVNESAVIRTGSVNPRVQIDSSGIFAYDSGGALKFSVDSATGALTAVDGTFSGAIEASLINSSYLASGTINGVLIQANTLTGNTISGGTVTGALISGGTVSGGNGTAVINTAGLEFALSSGTAFANEPTIKWKRSSTVAASFGGRYDSSVDYLWGNVGVDGTKQGEFRVYTYGPSANSNTWYLQNDVGFNFWETTGGSLRVIQSLNHTEIAAYKSIVPYHTYGSVSLGNSSTGFKYVFLQDSSNNRWKVEVNTSGVLVVSAA